MKQEGTSEMCSDRDNIRSLLAAIIPTTIAGTPITVQPGMVQGMVDFLRMSDVEAGYVASAEVGGLMVATVLFAFISHRVPWRAAFLFGLILVASTSLMSAFVPTGALFTSLRVCAGFGAGLVAAIGFVAIGETRDPARNFGWVVASIIGYSAIILWALPAIFDIDGYRALAIGYAILIALCIPVDRYLPVRRVNDPDNVAESRSTGRGLSLRAICAIVSVLTFFIGYAAAWTYMALLGRGAGLSEGAIAHVLSISQFFGVAGALSVVALSRRVGELVQTAVTLGLGAAGIFAFAFKDHGLFLVLNCIFQFAWNAGQPLLLGIVASRDPDGRILRVVIPVQYIGLAIGPGIAAYLLGASQDYASVMIGSGVFAAVSLAIILPIVAARQGKAAL